MRPLLLVLSVSVLGSPTVSYAQEITKTITATPRTGEWKGWGKYSEPNPEGPGNLTVRDKFTRVKFQPGQPREFSGKVEGLTSYAGVQVGLVSIVDVWWINEDAYEWAPVQADGTFRITAQRYPDAEKALCLRAPNRPWTFLHANFRAREGASDVILHPEPGKRVRISARLADGTAVRWLAVEPFEAYRSFDNQNQPLAKQRYGRYTSQDGDLVVTLPLEPVALYLSGSGAANCYAIVDPAESDHYEFVLFPAGRIRGTLTKDGKPVVGAAVRLFNDAEPLSVRGSTTNDKGEWQSGGLAPGEWSVTAGGATSLITIKPGETRDLNGKGGNLDTIKTVPATPYFYAARKVKVADVGKTAGELIDPLYESLKANGLESAGELEFHYIDMDGNPDRPFTLHVAIPIKEVKPVTGTFAIKTSPAFKCVSTTYNGSMNGLPQAWADAIDRIIKSGKQLGPEGREVYWKFSKPDAEDNSTEIQVGIQ